MTHLVQPLAVTSDAVARASRYEAVLASIAALLDGEDDWIAAMATAACELHHGFEYFHWTGFYRATSHDMLVIGPYQGGHGCLSIAFSRGVCGAAARTRTTQRVADVAAFPGHIPCASSTQSEIVVPIVTPGGRLLGVLDVDSNHPAAFTEVDQQKLEELCTSLGERFAETRIV